MKFLIKYLVTFTEEILNGKLYFLCSLRVRGSPYSDIFCVVLSSWYPVAGGLLRILGFCGPYSEFAGKKVGKNSTHHFLFFILPKKSVNFLIPETLRAANLQNASQFVPTSSPEQFLKNIPDTA